MISNSEDLGSTIHSSAHRHVPNTDKQGRRKRVYHNIIMMTAVNSAAALHEIESFNAAEYSNHPELQPSNCSHTMCNNICYTCSTTLCLFPRAV